MSTFSSIDIARTGVGVSRYWMDTVAHNLANANTVNPAGEEPFRQRLVVAQEIGGGPYAPTGSGARVGDLVEDESEPHRAYDPANPLSDAEGYVTQPVIDLAGQFADLMLANRTLQANLKTIETGREAYQSALRLGAR